MRGPAGNIPAGPRVSSLRFPDAYAHDLVLMDSRLEAPRMYTVLPTKSHRSTMAMLVIALGLLLSVVADLLLASQFGAMCDAGCDSVRRVFFMVLSIMLLSNGLTLGLTLLLRKRLAVWLALPAILITASPLIFTIIVVIGG
jgi:hypothetical protein